MSENVPPDLKYTKSHEWLRNEGGVAAIGITDHAQHELTDVVFVELPAMGRKLKAGESCAVVESVKTASDIYSLGDVLYELLLKLGLDLCVPLERKIIAGGPAVRSVNSAAGRPRR